MNNFNNKNMVLLVGILFVAMVGFIGVKSFMSIREKQEEMRKELEELKEKNEEREEKDEQGKEEVIEDELIVVPDVTGMSVSDAIILLQKEGFAVAGGTVEIESDTIKVGKVVKSNPPAGTKCDKGLIVTIYVSKGLSKILIEDYTGRNHLEVKATLEALGILVYIEYREGNSENDGTVIMQSVNKGSELKSGDSITLYVVKEIPKYPDFTDGSYTVDDVKAFCDEYGVTLNIQNVSHGSKKGTIIEQSRPVGYTVVEGTNLTIKVSTGN